MFLQDSKSIVVITLTYPNHDIDQYRKKGTFIDWFKAFSANASFSAKANIPLCKVIQNIHEL